MKIILDAMGGDNAPDEIVKRAGEAVAKNWDNLTLVLVGTRRSSGPALPSRTLHWTSAFEIVNTTTLRDVR